MEKQKRHIYFLNDESFIEWRITQSEELTQYWTEYLRNHPEDVEAIGIAIEKFKVVRFNDRKLSDIDTNDLWSTITQDIDIIINRRKRKRISIYLSLAASIAILIIAGFLTYKQSVDQTFAAETIVGEKLPDANIQLFAGNNVIKIDSEIQLTVDSNNRILIKGAKESKEANLSTMGTLNKIVVPYGKRTTLTLDDGTKVWINSGTELEFPSSFDSRTKREIKVKGEIYIEVAENKSKQFIVHTSQFDVKVHGTKFNIMAYDDMSEESVVLVDGKVEVNTNKTEATFLSPNDKLGFYNGLVHKSSVNAQEYISWKDNILIINRETLTDIIKKIERYYNFSFKTTEDLSLYNKTISGKLVLSENIDDIMKALSVISSTTYTREGDKIYITNKTKKPM